MSGTATEISAIDRAQIRAALDALEREARQHFVDDAHFQQDCMTKLDQLIKRQAFVAGGIAVLGLLLGFLGLSFSWTLQHAVIDGLMSPRGREIIRYEMTKGAQP